MSNSPAIRSSRLHSRRTNPIFRVKTGCLRCRARKKKCDERKPTCRACERNDFHCEWPSTVLQPASEQNLQEELRTPNALEGKPRIIDRRGGQGDQHYESRKPRQISAASFDRIEIQVTTNAKPATQEHNNNSILISSSSLPVTPAVSTSSGESNTSSYRSNDSHSRSNSKYIESGGIPPVQDIDEEDTVFPTGTEEDVGYVSSTSSVAAASPMALSGLYDGNHELERHQPLFLPRNMSLLPEYGLDGFQLLGHYMSRTAQSMSNGFNQTNPFLSQFIPLAFSSDIILRLILAQSAAHRAVLLQNQNDVIAGGHYSRSVMLFRKSINDHIGGKEVNPLMLAVGALIMCFTETAKGDTNGMIFDHFSASTHLLMEALHQNSNIIPKDLQDFLVEYCSYIATLSTISTDTSVSSQSLLTPELEELARELVSRQYIGSLCGCWLELLLLIPEIFALGRQWKLYDQTMDHELGTPNLANTFTENISSFAYLQSRILRWSPHSCDTSDGVIAARIFQQATLLYLYTSLDNTSEPSGPNYSSLIDVTLIECMSLFDQISPTARINTSLCWPIAIVGSCLHTNIWRQKLRNHLNTMLGAIGLGNIRQTLQVLEYMWKRPSDETGPWNICRVMQDHQIWISFA